MKFADEFEMLHNEERSEYRQWAVDLRESMRRAIDKYAEQQVDDTPVFAIQAFKPLVCPPNNTKRRKKKGEKEERKINEKEEK